MDEQLLPRGDIDCRATEGELVAASTDFDTQALLDLAQMAVELATQRSQVAHVIGLEV